jgi:Asp-tRNA(Asn)/Glu-tRNA(Gln) amidotransferase A subunit family amidase
MLRKSFVLLLTFLLVSDLFADQQGFDVFELNITELQAAMERGDTTSREIVQGYLDRIEAFDQRGPKLNAIIHINPRALQQAKALDRERLETGARGPLHGIPVILKDNYDTYDMPTTAGAIALAGFVPPDDAYQVRKLREAGAVLIGKSHLHEFARGIETVSSLGGYTLNPYDPRRNPGGSSGGTAAAVAAGYAAVGMGSDTCGSIRIPAAHNNLFGIRVTQGLSSRDGIIPLSHTQDVGGPIARSVSDLVAILDVTVGMEPADPQTSLADGQVPESYRGFLQAGALKDARLGLLTDYVRGYAPYGEVSQVFRQAVEALADNGAEVVDVQIDGLDDLLKNTSVIDMEFVADLEGYLQASKAPVQNITEILNSGRYHEALEQRYRRSVTAATRTEEYTERLNDRERLAQLLQESMTTHDLDALLYPTIRTKPAFVGEGQFGSVCRIAAHSGFPAITMPAGFTRDGLPVGLELLARPFEEGQLLGLAFAWEQVAQPRRPPPRTPSLVNDALSYPFVIEGEGISGKLRLERPKQTLHYRFRLAGVSDRDILDLKLHRGASGVDGPVISLLGKQRKGSVAISNFHLNDLLSGNLYLVVYTKSHPRGYLRGQLKGKDGEKGSKL